MNETLKIQVAYILERGCYQTARYVLKFGNYIEQLGFTFARISHKTYGDPTFEQWVNRLIEFIDSRYIILAYNYFCGLVESGLAPEEAFSLTIGVQQ